MQRRFAIAAAAAIVVTSIASTIFWARLPGRLPTDADYEKVNAEIERQHQPGDVITLAPSWADRGRPFLTAADTTVGYDLTEDTGASRQWLVALADAPRFDLQRARDEMQTHAAGKDGKQIGQLWLELFTPAHPVLYSFMRQLSEAQVSVAWPNRSPELCTKSPDGVHHCSAAQWNVVKPGWFEVKEEGVHCMWAHPVQGGELRIEYPDAPLHGTLKAWGALVGKAAESNGAPVDMRVEAAGQTVHVEQFPNAFGKHHFEAKLTGDASAKGPLAFVVSTPNAGMRHFCFDAWVEQ